MSLGAGAKRSAAKPPFLGCFSWVWFLEREDNKWESGNLLLVFHFSTRSRGCGNVGIAQRFPRAVGNEGKPGFGFPRFPRARHFHGLLAFLTHCAYGVTG